MTDLKSYIRLLRIDMWVPCFSMALFGYIISDGFLIFSVETTIFFLILFLYLGFSFAINNCFDVKEDKLSKKDNPIATGKLSFRKALIFSMSIAFFSLILSLYFGLNIFLFYLVTLLMSLFYSAPPLRFKSRFMLDILSHGLFFGALLFFLPLIIFNSGLSLFHYSIAFSIFWFSIILELRNHVADYEGDKRAGLRTSVCILGKDKSENFLRIMELIYPATLIPVLFLSQNSLWVVLFAILSTIVSFRRDIRTSKCLKFSYNWLCRLFIAR